MTRRITIFAIVVGILIGAAFPAIAAGPGRSPAALSACSQRIGNGGFEDGPGAAVDPWVAVASPSNELITSTLSYSGVYSARLAGGVSEVDVISQTVSIPVTTTHALLSYTRYMTTNEGLTQAFDVLTVTLRSQAGAVLQTLETIDNRSTRSQWIASTFDLSSYAGQTVQVHFLAKTDFSLPTSFYIDDVALSACQLNNAVYLPMITLCKPTLSDPGFTSQPDMPQINADDAWLQCALGDPDIVVAIIDTGVDLDHPDLIDNLIPGYDFYDNDTVPDDGHGHGSNVAGIAGAALNGVGVIGVAPQTHLLPVRVLGNSGLGPISAIAAGINYAADNADVLNLSLGSTTDFATIKTAVAYAVNTKGRLVVAAAGNCGDPATYMANGCSFVDQSNYPAAYSTIYPNVMAVAAVDGSDNQAIFSNQGMTITIAAPGVNIYNTDKNGGYTSKSGTSQAAPHVAGLAALIWSRNPTFTATQVRQAIESSAVDLGSAGKDIQFGWGRIDVTAALGLSSAALAAAPDEAAPAPDSPAALEQRDREFVPGRVLIKFKPGVDAAGIDRTLSAFAGVSVEGQIGGLGIQILRAPIGQEWALIDQLRALPEVEFAEPDYIIRLEPVPLSS